MIIVIGGPTASGKSSMAIEVAKKYNAEIVNGDAFQIYQEMDIGTAKTSEEEFGNIKHHLFSFVSPMVSYSVANYQEAFRRTISALLKEQKNIVIVGGTGLYIRAGLFDYEFAQEQEKDDDSIYEKYSNEELHALLEKIDKESADKIHTNNRKRILRALAICNKNELTKSEIEANQKHKIIYDDVKVFAIDVDREKLYEKINERVDNMFDLGLINEVKNLRDKYGPSCRAFAAIGYKEVNEYFDGKLTLEETKELIKKNTRNYAKRQVTFFKHQFDTIWIKNLEDLYNAI